MAGERGPLGDIAKDLMDQLPEVGEDEIVLDTDIDPSENEDESLTVALWQNLFKGSIELAKLQGVTPRDIGFWGDADLTEMGKRVLTFHFQPMFLNLKGEPLVITLDFGWDKILTSRASAIAVMEDGEANINTVSNDIYRDPIMPLPSFQGMLRIANASLMGAIEDASVPRISKDKFFPPKPKPN